MDIRFADSANRFAERVIKAMVTVTALSPIFNMLFLVAHDHMIV